MPRKKLFTQEELDEKRRVYQREYTKRRYVKERINKTKKKQREINGEKEKKYKSKLRKKLRKNNPIHFLGEAIKTSAKKRGLSAPYSNTEYRDWFKSQNQKCTYCGNDVDRINQYLNKLKINKTFRRLAVDRKDPEKGYEFNNMVLACYVCNTSKQAIFSHKDFLEIADKYIKPKINKF